MDSILEIVQKIQADKKAKKKVPDFALKREIWNEIFLQMETELELLYHDGKLKKGDSINDVFFEVKD